MTDINKLVEEYFSTAPEVDSFLNLLEGLKLEAKKAAPERKGRFSYAIPIPTFTPSEAWGDPTSQDREEINKLFRAVSGGASIQERIQSMNTFLDPKSAARKRSPSAIINMMMIVEALQATLNDYNESASGFVFEGFMAALTGGKQISGKVAGTLPIEDFVAFSEFGEGLPVSLKLLGPETPVKGSLTNIIDFLLVRGKPSIKYLVAYKLTKGTEVQKLNLFAFDITIGNFIDFIVGTNGQALLAPYKPEDLKAQMQQFAANPNKKTMLPPLAKIITQLSGYNKQGLLHKFTQSGELPRAKSPEEEEEEKERKYAAGEKAFGRLDTRYEKEKERQQTIQDMLEESINRGELKITLSEAFHYIEKQTLLMEGSDTGTQWNATHPQLIALSSDINLERFGQIDLSQENIDELVEIYSEKLKGGIMALLGKAKDLTENVSDYYTKEKRSAAQASGERAKTDATEIKEILEDDPRYQK